MSSNTEKYRVKYTPKQAVEILCGKPSREELEETTKLGIPSEAVFCYYRCPLTDCEKHTELIRVERGAGFTNPYKHVKTAHCNQSYELMDELVDRYKQQKQQASAHDSHSVGTLGMYFTARYTEQETTIYDWVLFLIRKSAPLSWAEDDDVREFSKCASTTSTDTLRKVMRNMVVLVEKMIRAEMADTTAGAIMHDAWTRSGTHYLGLYAVYCKKRLVAQDAAVSASVMKKQKASKSSAGSVASGDQYVYDTKISLLSVAPLTEFPEEVDSDELGEEDETLIGERLSQVENETVRFTAEKHEEHIRNIMHNYYGKITEAWAVASIADNAAVCQKLARLLGLPHVGCTNHKLNLEVQLMCRDETDPIFGTLESVHETMHACKTKLVNRAVLRKVTNLAPKLNNKTRWSSKREMLERFCQIHVEIVQASNYGLGETIPVDNTHGFKKRTKRYMKHLIKIDVVCKILQRRGVKLADCRDALDTLMHTITEAQDDRNAILYKCRLGDNYIHPTANICPDPHFESAVVKIQQGRIEDLTQDEVTAAARLRVGWEAEAPAAEAAEPQSPEAKTMAQKIAKVAKKRLQASGGAGGYINCDFILGSAAEVERLWSLAKHILEDDRLGMHPETFEIIIFLKVNSRFWDKSTCCEAIRMWKQDEKQERVDRAERLSVARARAVEEGELSEAIESSSDDLSSSDEE